MMAMPAEVWMALTVVGLTLAASAIVVPFLRMVRTFLWEPLRLRHIMAKQGVQGPPFRLFFGNSPEYFAYAQTFPESLPLKFDDDAPTVTPHNALYFSKFGKRFLYSLGSETRLVVREPEMAKEVLMDKTGCFERAPLELYILSHIVGNGLFSSLGEEWVTQRRVLNPFFAQESIRGMVETMVKCATEEMRKWEQLTTQGGGMAEHDVEHDIDSIAEKIISCTAFGEADGEIGKQVKTMQTQMVGHLFAAVSSPNFWLPGYRFLPTKEKRAMAQLNRRIDRLVLGVIKARKEAVENGERSSYGDDMLGLMLTACDMTDETFKNFDYSTIIENCKNFYFAGAVTTANLINFTLVMLACYPEWQQRVRDEIFEVLGEEESFNFNNLSHLKVMGMFINEVSRAFTISSRTTRVATKDFQLGDLLIPKGLTVEIAYLSIHRDPALWGEDAAEFKPERFENGVSQACTHPKAFMPFGAGPRNCIGQKMALLEVKIVLSMTLRRFQLLPSPHYKHHPHYAMVTRPKYGMPLILKALKYNPPNSQMAPPKVQAPTTISRKISPAPSSLESR